MQFDAKKMMRLVKSDNFLKFSYDSHKEDVKAMGRDNYLQVMFNTYVKGDSVMTRAYEKA